MGVKSASPVRQGFIKSISPDIIVRVDNDGTDYRATSDLPPGTIVPNVRCTVANFGGRLTVIAVHGTTIPVFIEAGRSQGSAPPQNSLVMTAGTAIAEFDTDHHAITIGDGIYSNTIVACSLTPWSTSFELISVALKAMTATEIDFFVQVTGLATEDPVKVTYMAVGW